MQATANGVEVPLPSGQPLNIVVTLTGNEDLPETNITVNGGKLTVRRSSIHTDNNISIKLFGETSNTDRPKLRGVTTIEHDLGGDWFWLPEYQERGARFWMHSKTHQVWDTSSEVGRPDLHRREEVVNLGDPRVEAYLSELEKRTGKDLTGHGTKEK